MTRLILILCLLSLPAAADPLPAMTALPRNGGNDVLPTVIKRPVNDGCGRLGSTTCTPTKPTGGEVMSDTAQYLLFFGLQWGSAIGVWLWIRWRLARDAAAEREAREAWALVKPRDGCTRAIPGCICARDNLGEWCVHRSPR